MNFFEKPQQTTPRYCQHNVPKLIHFGTTAQDHRYSLAESSGQALYPRVKRTRCLHGVSMCNPLRLSGTHLIAATDGSTYGITCGSSRASQRSERSIVEHFCIPDHTKLRKPSLAHPEPVANLMIHLWLCCLSHAIVHHGSMFFIVVNFTRPYKIQFTLGRTQTTRTWNNKSLRQAR
eukprot:6490677-Amphidinium_carterae.6